MRDRERPEPSENQATSSAALIEKFDASHKYIYIIYLLCSGDHTRLVMGGHGFKSRSGQTFFQTFTLEI